MVYGCFDWAWLSLCKGSNLATFNKVAFCKWGGKGRIYLNSRWDPTYPLLGTAVGGSVGFIGGKMITNQLKPYIGGSSEVLGNTIGGYGSEVINGTISAAGEKK